MTIKQEIELPAYCEIMIEVDPNEAVRKHFWVQSFPALQSRFGIHVAQGITCRSKPIVKIANLSDKNVTLPEGTVVARGSRISNKQRECHS